MTAYPSNRPTIKERFLAFFLILAASAAVFSAGTRASILDDETHINASTGDLQSLALRPAGIGKLAPSHLTGIWIGPAIDNREAKYFHTSSAVDCYTRPSAGYFFLHEDRFLALRVIRC